MTGILADRLLAGRAGVPGVRGRTVAVIELIQIVLYRIDERGQHWCDLPVRWLDARYGWEHFGD